MAPFTLNVLCYEIGESVQVEVSESDTIECVLGKILDKVTADIADSALFHSGELLDEDKTVSDYKLCADSDLLLASAPHSLDLDALTFVVYKKQVYGVVPDRRREELVVLKADDMNDPSSYSVVDDPAIVNSVYNQYKEDLADSMLMDASDDDEIEDEEFD
ncbi:hypothetical protein P9112_006489 [Eukaryota sp. TZLM1-RC]